MSRHSPVSSPLGLASVLRGIFRRLPFVLTLTALSLLGGFLFLMANKPTYVAEAQVIIENLATPFDRTSGIQDATATNMTVDDRIVKSQMTVLKSDDIAARVVDQLSLDIKPEYNSNLRPLGKLSGILISIGVKDDPKSYTPKDLALKTLQDYLSIFAVPESNVIAIKSNSTDAGLAAATANALAETYVLSTHEIFAASTTRARSWLGNEITDLRAKVAASENAVEKYRSEAGLLKGSTSTLGTQQISELNSQITLAETAASEAAARADEIKTLLRESGTVDASSDVLSSPVIQSLRTQQANAQRKLSEVSAVYLPSHPKMIAAQKELIAVNALVRNEALKIVDSLNGQAKVAEMRAATLRSKLEGLKGRESEANFSDVKLKALQREADANRTLLENMLSRYADASARQDSNLQPGFARIVQKAVAPAVPSFPKTGPILILSGLIGLALGAGLAFVMEIASQSAITPAEYEPRRQRPHAIEKTSVAETEVPEIEFPTTQPPAKAPEANASVMSIMPAAITASAAADMLETDLASGSHFARATLRAASSLHGLKSKTGMGSFTFTSIGSSAPNAALTAIAVARALAQGGEKVIAVDISTGSAGFESLLGVGPGPGLGELIAGKLDFKKVISKDPGSKLHAIRLGSGLDDEAQALLVERLPSIVKALRQVYGMVVLHAGEATSSTASLIKSTDCVVLLAPQSRWNDATEAAKAIEQDGKTKTLLLKLEPQTPPLRAGAASA